MAKLSTKRANAFRYSLQKKAFAITGKRIRILEIKNNKDIGYTVAAEKIFLSFSHKLFDDLDEAKTMRCIQGVFAHEVMHKLLSSFKVLESACAKYSGATRRIYAQLNNILEDSFIENYAHHYLSDMLVRDILFMRAHVYRHSLPINEYKTPFEQFIYASIQYGDAGLVKGSFTDETARKCFATALPIMDKGLREPDAYQRAKYSADILNISRPLWESMVNLEDLLDEMFKELAKTLRGEGNPSGGGISGSPLETPTGDEEIPENDKDRRRKITFKRISKEEYEELKEESSSSGEEMPDGDITILVPDEPVEDKDDGSEEGGSPINIPSKENDGESDDGETRDSGTDKGSEATEDSDEPKGSDESEGSGDSENSDEGSEDNSGEGESRGAEGSKRDATSPDEKPDEGDESPSDNPSEAVDGGGESKAPNKSEELRTDYRPPTEDSSEYDDSVLETIDSEYEITDEDVDRIVREISDAEAVMAQEEREDEASDENPPNFPVSDGFKKACRARTCLNIKVNTPIDPRIKDTYHGVVSMISDDISRLVNQLTRIFRRDVAEKAYRASGKISVNRLADNRVTARVFTKNRNPSAKDDIAVVLLVDESGSMNSGGKITAARLSTIGLAEVFAKLKIPLSIIGFTADEGADAVHYHYLNWSNTLNDRLRLLNIKGRSNNFDGYSIRYASEYLKRKNAEHKLLIVISDGDPACRAYNHSDGCIDTKLAIKEASKNATVVGVLLGGANPKLHRELYGYNFIHIKNPSDLFMNLAKTIQKQIKNW